MLIGGMLVAILGWRPFFIALGVVSLLWLVPWLRWMPRTASCGATSMEVCPGLVEIVRQKSSWGTFIGLFCSNYFLYFLLTWLPLYLVEDRHFSMHSMAKVGGSVFLLAAASSLVCGRLTDRWIAAGASATRVRKGCMILATTCIGLCMAGAVLAPPVVSVGLLLLAGTSFGLISSNLNAITQTLAGPSAAGRWMGMQNFVGNMAGWVVPALTGFLVQRTGHYYWPFFITAAVVWIGTLDWLFLVGAVEPVAWKPNLRSIVAEGPQMVGEPSVTAPFQ
jgi:ACS family D-galactonate transporter-like MFS transporter